MFLGNDVTQQDLNGTRNYGLNIGNKFHFCNPFLSSLEGAFGLRDSTPVVQK